MEITLELPSELAAQLTVEANRHGLALDQYLLQVARNQVAPADRTSRTGEVAPTIDPYLAEAAVRCRAAADELERLGITDRNGNRLRTDLPEDMREGADRDFGG